jgi:hypothetical protein
VLWTILVSRCPIGFGPHHWPNIVLYIWHMLQCKGHLWIRNTIVLYSLPLIHLLSISISLSITLFYNNFNNIINDILRNHYIFSLNSEPHLMLTSWLMFLPQKASAISSKMMQREYFFFLAFFLSFFRIFTKKKPLH